MGFYFRKSLGFGPFRLNLSKSGIGASFGIRGARISAGPRGTYINVGRDGFYYRQKLDVTPRVAFPPRSGSSAPVIGDESSRIESADVDQLIDSSTEELLGQINACASRPMYSVILTGVLAMLTALYVVIFTGKYQDAHDAFSLGTAVAEQRTGELNKARELLTNKKRKAAERKSAEQHYASLESEATVAQKAAQDAHDELDRVGRTVRIAYLWLLVIDIVGVIGIFSIYRRDRIARQKLITYALDEKATAQFKTLEQGCQHLAQAACVWRVETEQSTPDWKRNAGASALLTRTSCRVIKDAPPYIKTNLVPWTIQCGGITLYFLPDHLFLFQHGRFGVVPYSSLSVEVCASSFRENDAVPSDAKVIGYTWIYVNKDGGPDRRFASNRQIPIALYPQIDMLSAKGFRLRIQVSNESRAAAFASAVLAYTRIYTAPAELGPQTNKYSSREEAKPSSERNQRRKSAFEALGIPPDSSSDQIKAAYHKMAQQYHPDKVASLGPEFRELAERRMKEINAAYHLLQTI